MVRRLKRKDYRYLVRHLQRGRKTSQRKDTARQTSSRCRGTRV